MTQLLALPVWTFDIWRSHLDDVCAVVWWSAFAAVRDEEPFANAPGRRSSPWRAPGS